MGTEYPAKVFKSGNSMALRLPKSLGLTEGDVGTIEKADDGNLVVRLTSAPKRKFNIAKVAGSARNLQFIKPEDRVFEERPSVLAKRASADSPSGS